MPRTPEPARRVTMRHVAKAAGVSLKTVSRVVNAEPGVDPRTQERVEAAITALAYRRNDMARNLRMGIPVATIGLVIEDLANPFYAVVARAVEEVAQRHGHAVIFTSSGEDPEREEMQVRDLIQRGAAGLIIVPAATDHRYLEPDLHRGTRVVFLDRPSTGIPSDEVLIDNVGGARSGVEHLIRHGHQRIAFVGDPLSVATSAERLKGYRAALAGAGIPIDEALIRTGTRQVERAEEASRQLLALDDPPTAIFAHNNRNCIGVLRAMRAAGVTLALVGFDDFELADMLEVPVSVVSYDLTALGREAAELLFARIAGDQGPPRRIVIPTRVIARGSGERSPTSG